MSALAGARAERAALRDRPAPAGTLDLSLGVFGFARDSRVLNVKAAGVPVVCSHDLGSSHHDRRHFIDKDFLLSLPDGAHLLEAARATEPSPACRAVICLADADVVALGDAPDAHPSSAASLRVLGMLPAPLPVTLRVRPGALAGSLRDPHAGDPHAGASRKIHARLADVVVVERLPVPAHVSLRFLTESSARAERDDVVADLVLSACDPRAPRTSAGAFPVRYRTRGGWEGVVGDDDRDDVRSDEARSEPSSRPRVRGDAAARRWFANGQKRASRVAAVHDAEDRFAAERHRLGRAPDHAVAVACARCGAREGKREGGQRALRRCAGCAAPGGVDGKAAPDAADGWEPAYYCSKACQARHWGRHRDVCHAGLAGRRRRRTESIQIGGEARVVGAG